MANTGIPLSTSFLQLNNVIADERANSYVTAADFAAYWTNHWNGTLAATMLALTVPQTEMLLVQACRIIETLHFTEPVDPLADYHLVYDSRQQQIRSVKTNYGRPQKYNYFQFLQFPRTLDIYQDGTLYIPYPVQAAQCEQAAYLYTFDTTLLEDSLQGLSRQAINVSGVSISQTIRPKGSMLCAEAYNYVKYLLINQCMRLQRA
jgi:hypothetical protein